jgi:hypothetical protein
MLSGEHEGIVDIQKHNHDFKKESEDVKGLLAERGIKPVWIHKSGLF